MRRRVRLPPALAVVLAAALAAPPARAQFTVFDPTNYAQNLLQAARALEQVQHQVQSLQNEAQMLAGQARDLSPLGLRAAGALNGDLARVAALLGEAGRLARDVQGLRAQYDQLYASVADASGPGLAAAAEARWANSVEALRRTLSVQAQVVAGLSATTAQADALARAGEGAEGGLQAAQVQAQLLAVQSKQLADLTALLAAQGQAEALEQARAAAGAADGRARLQRFLGTSRP
jgi:P-type conjugative transfer protein TrbJ